MRHVASKTDISKIIAVLCDAFPSFKPGYTKAEAAQKLEGMVRTYHLILGDLDTAGLMQAAIHLATHATFFPSAGELRRTYFTLRERAAGVPSAQDAWAETKQLFRRGFSRAHAPTEESVTHPRVLRAIEGIGGWRALCDSTNDAADRARYLQAYEAYTEREQEQERMLPSVRAMVEQLAERMRAPQLEDKT
jgi:hypothetical protein